MIGKYEAIEKAGQQHSVIDRLHVFWLLDLGSNQGPTD